MCRSPIQLPVATPSGSLIDLHDDCPNDVLDHPRSVDANTPGPAVLDLSGLDPFTSNINLSHGSRSRTSSVSSQASDSFFSPSNIPASSRHLTLPSDVESITSEAESGGASLDVISKEEMYKYYCRVQQRSQKYRWKFSQVLLGAKFISSSTSFFVVVIFSVCF